MWIFDSPSLSASIDPPGLGGSLLCLNPVNSTQLANGHLLQFALQDFRVGSPVPISSPIGLVDGLDERLIDFSSDEFRTLEAIAINGRVFTPASDPTQREPFTFDYNPYSGVALIYTPPMTNLIADGLTAQSIGRRQAIKSDRYLGPIPQVLDLLPIEGQINATLTLEGHPSGSLSLYVSSDIESAKQVFQNGLQVELFGVGFTLQSPTFAESSYLDNPSLGGAIDISLAGYWEWHSGQPSYLRGKAPLAGLEDAFSSQQTMALAFTTDTSFDDLADSGSTAPPPSIALSDLVLQSGASYLGTPYTVNFPSDTDANSTVNWLNIVRERAKAELCVVDLTNPRGIGFISLENTPVRQYSELDISGPVKTTFNTDLKQPTVFNSNLNRRPGSTLPSSLTQALIPTTVTDEDLTAYPVPFRYENFRISANFSRPPSDESASEEDSQGSTETARQLPPLWIRRQPVKRTIQTGDPFASMPPGGTVTSVTQAYDITGITKTTGAMTLLDDFPVSETVETYGYLFTGAERENSDDANLYWASVESYKRTYRTSPEGYDLGWVLSGSKQVRAKAENPEAPETVGLPETDPTYSLFQFKRIPLRGRRDVFLGQIRDYYPEFDAPPQVETFERTLSDAEAGHLGVPTGTTVIDNTIRRDYVEPMFVLDEGEYVTALERTPNPERTGPGDQAQDYYSGQESKTSSSIKPVPEGTVRSDQAFSAGDANFSGAINNASTSRQSGPPSEARRRPSLWNLVPQKPERSEGNPERLFGTDSSGTSAASGVEFYLASGDYTGPEGGSISYEYAEDANEVLASAKTDLILRTLSSGRAESIRLPFNPLVRPGDRVVIIYNGLRRRRIIRSVTWNNILLEGFGANRRISGSMAITLGEDRSSDKTNGPDSVKLLRRDLSNAAGGGQPGSALLHRTISSGLAPYYTGRTLGSRPTSNPPSTRQTPS